MMSLLICLMLLHAAALNEVAATVLLGSSIESGRRFACDGNLVTFTCEVCGSASLVWNNPRISQITFLSDDIAPITLTRGPFLASLTSRVGDGSSANFTSTLQVNASRDITLADTTVRCNNEEANFTAAEIPDAPMSFTVDSVERSSGSVTITASWMEPPNFEQFTIARYDINVSSTSGVQQMTTANGGMTSITLTVNENPGDAQETTFSMTIAAVNLCWETGTAATASSVITTTTRENPLNTPLPIGLGITGGAGWGLGILSAILIICYYRCYKKRPHKDTELQSTKA